MCKNNKIPLADQTFPADFCKIVPEGGCRVTMWRAARPPAPPFVPYLLGAGMPVRGKTQRAAMHDACRCMGRCSGMQSTMQRYAFSGSSARAVHPMRAGMRAGLDRGAQKVRPGKGPFVEKLVTLSGIGAEAVRLAPAHAPRVRITPPGRQAVPDRRPEPARAPAA